MARPRDYAFEALVRATHANVAMERGKLNGALAAIREAWETEGGHPGDLPQEIERRAQAYHDTWPMLTITPSALATHWFRVMAEKQRRSPTERAIDELRRETE